MTDGLKVSLASPAVAVALVAALALDMCPESNGGCGSYSMLNWIALAPLLPGDLACQPQPQVDAGRHARRGHQTCVAGAHDALIADRGHPERLQQWQC